MLFHHQTQPPQEKQGRLLQKVKDGCLDVTTDSVLERFPSGKFDTDELVLALAMLAYNILNSAYNHNPTKQYCMDRLSDRWPGFVYAFGLEPDVYRVSREQIFNIEPPPLIFEPRQVKFPCPSGYFENRQIIQTRK